MACIVLIMALFATAAGSECTNGECAFDDDEPTPGLNLLQTGTKLHTKLRTEGLPPLLTDSTDCLKTAADVLEYTKAEYAIKKGTDTSYDGETNGNQALCNWAAPRFSKGGCAAGLDVKQKTGVMLTFCCGAPPAALMESSALASTNATDLPPCMKVEGNSCPDAADGVKPTCGEATSWTQPNCSDFGDTAGSAASGFCGCAASCPVAMTSLWRSTSGPFCGGMTKQEIQAAVAEVQAVGLKAIAEKEQAIAEKERGLRCLSTLGAETIDVNIFKTQCCACSRSTSCLRAVLLGA